MWGAVHKKVNMLINMQSHLGFDSGDKVPEMTLPAQAECQRNFLIFLYQEINMPSSKNSGGESKRGFASMDQDKQREIASKGGKAAHEKGTAHEFDSEEAREAGRKGGEASHGGGKGRSSSSRGGSSPGQHGKASGQSHKND